MLRITEGELVVNGKKGKVYSIQQPDGTLGYVGTKGQPSKVVLQNHTQEPMAIHWHGVLLPNGQHGVPLCHLAPMQPGEERRSQFPIAQAGTYWMHSHLDLQEQGMMTAPLILKDPADSPGGGPDVVMLLNDWTSRGADQILAELQGSETKAASAESMKMPGSTGHTMQTTPGGKTTSPAGSERPPGAMSGMAMGQNPWRRQRHQFLPHCLRQLRAAGPSRPVGLGVGSGTAISQLRFKASREGGGVKTATPGHGIGSHREAGRDA